MERIYPSYRFLLTSITIIVSLSFGQSFSQQSAFNIYRNQLRVQRNIFYPEEKTSTDSSNFSQIFIPETIQFSLGFIHLDYNENLPVQPVPLKSTEQGSLPGFSLGICTKKYSSANLYATINYFTGNDDYDGTLQNGEPKKATTGSTFFQFIIGTQYSFNISQYTSLTPHINFSYRLWDRQLSKGENGSYLEVYKCSSLPFGCRIEFQTSEQMSFGCDVYVNPMMSGSILIHLSQLSSMLPNVETNLGAKTGFGISIPIIYQINDQWAFSLNPYYEQYAFGESKQESIIVNGQPGYVMEPSSNTKMFGVTLAAKLKL